MKDRTRTLTVMVHRDGDLSSRSIRMPLWLARAAAVCGFGLGVVALLAVVLYAPIVRTAARVPGLKREMARLEAENRQVSQLAAALEETEARYEQVRTLLGAQVIPARAPGPTSPPSARPITARVGSAAPRYEDGPSEPHHWPLDERGFVTRGMVESDGNGEGHTGVDIAVPVGSSIRASGGGEVKAAGVDPEYGLFVRVVHPGGYESMYGHASRLLVRVGDAVAAGEVIALSGSTGRSTAPHLHFELRQGGRPVDPLRLVREGS